MTEEQPTIRSTPYMSPMHNYAGSIVMLTNPENDLHKLELTFRSLKEGARGELIETGEPLMNELGVSSVMGIIQSIVSQVTIMSNFTKNEIPMLMDFLGDTLARDLMMNRVTYDIKSPAARDKIYFTALSSSFICMKRAYEEGEKRFWKGSQQEIKTTVESNQKKGWLSSINPLR